MARILDFLALAGFAAVLVSPAHAQDATAGQKVFAKCAVCHGIGDAKKPIGPNLNGVIGRTAGTEPEFLAKKGAGYSKAMVAAGAGGLVWDAAQIGEYLTDPKKKIPGNKMAFPGLKVEKDRLDVIAYVTSFSTAPAAAPAAPAAAPAAPAAAPAAPAATAPAAPATAAPAQ